MQSVSRFVEARKLQLVQTIQSLPEGAGLALKTLNPEIAFFKQERPCEYCGVVFLPPQFGNSGLTRFCGKSCSASWRMRQPQYIANVHNPEVAAKRGKSLSRFYAEGSPKAEQMRARIAGLNPMANPEIREKVSHILKRMKHKPSVRGGNGAGMTVPQTILLDVLGSGWVPEYALPLGTRKAGYPTHYKIDLANVAKKIAIEVDGNSHRASVRKARDVKKDAMLASLGWTVLRFWNEDILSWSDSGMPTGSFIFTTLEQHGIQVFRSKDS